MFPAKRFVLCVVLAMASTAYVFWLWGITDAEQAAYRKAGCWDIPGPDPAKCRELQQDVDAAFERNTFYHQVAYVLSIPVGACGLWFLVGLYLWFKGRKIPEKKQAKEVGGAVIKIRCPYCQALNAEDVSKCHECRAALT